MSSSISDVPALLRVVSVLMATMLAVDAQPAASGVAPGVNPKDYVTKAEVILNYFDLEVDARISTTAFRFDYVFNSVWGGNIEVPFTHYAAPGLVEAGIGDVALRLRNVHNFGRISVISAAEAVAPMASDASLGTGRRQINPIMGGVYAFDDFNFAFLEYRHYFSVDDSRRPDIDRSEVRALLAHFSPRGLCVLGDLKNAMAHIEPSAENLDPEMEYGIMVAEELALSSRIDPTLLDSPCQAGLTINPRKIW